MEEIGRMKIAVVYVCPGDVRYDNYICRFLQSYSGYPTEVEHECIVMLNGINTSTDLLCMFSCLKNVRLIEHDNSGWDIGAFQHAAKEVPCDMMVFFGTTSWIKGPRWLDRMADVFVRRGDNLYGCMGNRGAPIVGVYPHIRTTGFWVNPQLMNEYPLRVSRPDQRYPFEHGQNCFTHWVTQVKNRDAFVVTWTGEYLWKDWDNIPNGFHRGNQSALLIGDRVSDPPYHPIP